MDRSEFVGYRRIACLFLPIGSPIKPKVGKSEMISMLPPTWIMVLLHLPICPSISFRCSTLSLLVPGCSFHVANLREKYLIHVVMESPLQYTCETPKHASHESRGSQRLFPPFKVKHLGHAHTKKLAHVSHTGKPLGFHVVGWTIIGSPGIPPQWLGGPHTTIGAPQSKVLKDHP
jgi:hypothetical protein